MKIYFSLYIFVLHHEFYQKPKLIRENLPHFLQNFLQRFYVTKSHCAQDSKLWKKNLDLQVGMSYGSQWYHFKDTSQKVSKSLIKRNLFLGTGALYLYLGLLTQNWKRPHEFSSFNLLMLNESILEILYCK